MTDPMTPTEQDKELEAQLDKIFPCDCSFTKGFAFKSGDPCDGSCVNAPYKKAVLELITADRKRVALEARIDELENRLRVQFIPSHWARLCAEVNSWAKYVDRRIAELKAQQEEV